MNEPQVKNEERTDKFQETLQTKPNAVCRPARTITEPYLSADNVNYVKY
jgi:hypothetical protein